MVLIKIKTKIMNNKQFKKRPKSGYYKRMIFFSIASLIGAIAWGYCKVPVFCTIFTVFAFIFWFGAVMAPYEEKYKC
jgi:hypothetical protein